jgi:hypothetical protein
MCFVDGENLTIRGQNLATATSLKLRAGPFWRKNAFLWFPNQSPISLLSQVRSFPNWCQPLRSHYYASVTGGTEVPDEVRRALWDLGFQPEVFRKPDPATKAKGVDIALARDLLTNAYFGNYDIAFLFAGDGDYVPLVTEVKRFGRIVCVAFFESDGLHAALRLAADHFLPLDSVFDQVWRAYTVDSVPS